MGLHNEKAGTIPSNEWKIANLKEPWYEGETPVASIGQGYITTTPREALSQAQDLGFAEQDPSNDIKGIDARYRRS